MSLEVALQRIAQIQSLLAPPAPAPAPVAGAFASALQTASVAPVASVPAAVASSSRVANDAKPTDPHT